MLRFCVMFFLTPTSVFLLRFPLLCFYVSGYSHPVMLRFLSFLGAGCCYVYARFFGRSKMIVLQPGAAFLLVLPYLVDTDVSLGLGLFPPCIRRVGCSPPIGRRVGALNVPVLMWCVAMLAPFSTPRKERPGFLCRAPGWRPRSFLTVNALRAIVFPMGLVSEAVCLRVYTRTAAWNRSFAPRGCASYRIGQPTLVSGFHAAGLNHAAVLSKGILAYSLCA